MNIKTPCGSVVVPDSVLVKSNNKKIIRNFQDEKGTPCSVAVTIAWDDKCGNGHNTLSITGTYSEFKSGTYQQVCSGAILEIIAKHVPELKKFLPYHLVGSTGPMHYFANTTHLAGDRDCWGTKAGEQQRSPKGILKWQLSKSPFNVVFSDQLPAPKVVKFVPMMGEGKDPEYDAARSTLKLPLATIEELSQPIEVLIQSAKARGVELTPIEQQNLAYFLGTADCFGHHRGVQKTMRGRFLWKAESSPFAQVDTESPEPPPPLVIPYNPLMGKGKDRELALARKTAVWPDATDEQLMAPKEELEKMLADRLPSLMLDFKRLVEELGFQY